MSKRVIRNLVAVNNCLFPTFQPLLNPSRLHEKSDFYAEPLEKGQASVYLAEPCIIETQTHRRSMSIGPMERIPWSVRQLGVQGERAADDPPNERKQVGCFQFQSPVAKPGFTSRVVLSGRSAEELPTMMSKVPGTTDQCIFRSSSIRSSGVRVKLTVLVSPASRATR
jgi:hypothetical protein